MVDSVFLLEEDMPKKLTQKLHTFGKKLHILLTLISNVSQ